MKAFLFRLYRRTERIGSWFRRRFTPSGQLLLALATGAAILGVDTRQNPVHQLFALAATCLGAALLATWRLRPELAARRFLPDRATAGIPISWTLEIRNTGRRPLARLWCEEELPVSWPQAAEVEGFTFRRWFAALERKRLAECGEQPLPSLAVGETATVELSLLPRRRGWLEWPGLRLGRRDPLNLARAAHRLELPGRLLVLPKSFPVSVPQPGGSRHLKEEEAPRVQSVGNEDEFVGLRDWRPGDPLRHVHWRSFARLGRPVVREYEDEYFVRHALVLDTCGKAGETFEAAVSVAASFTLAGRSPDSILDLMFAGGAAVRLSAGRGMGSELPLLEALACAEADPRGRFTDLSGLVLEHVGEMASCILVFLAWDDERAALVDNLREHGLWAEALVVGNATGPFVTVDPADPAAALATLPW